jgi:hypothetical protein
MGGIGGEPAHQLNRQIQPLQQEIYRNCRRESFLRHPGQIEWAEIWATTLDTTRVDFLLEFAKRPQPSFDRVPAEASNEANQSGLKNRETSKHLTLDYAARLHCFGDSDEHQARPSVNLARLRANTNRFAAV